MCPPLHAAVCLIASAEVRGAGLPLHALALELLCVAALSLHVHYTTLTEEVIMYLWVGYH